MGCSPWGREKSDTTERLYCHFSFYFHYSMIIEDLALVYVIECSMFSSKSFIVSGLIFRSLIHFEFTFVYSIRTEKAMAPHSSPLAWKIPWMEEAGRLQSMGS